MKRRAWLIALTSLVLVGFVWVLAPTTVGAQAPPPLPPIEVDGDNPLLLDTGTPEEEEPEPEPFDPWGPPKPAGANNDSCLVCHKNFEKEGLAKTHKEANIGCTKCHGESAEHRADEDNAIPPEKMYAGDMINKMCTTECHDEHKANPRKVVGRWLERCPEKKDPKTIVCTDCHGYHRLKFRTVQWNEETGEMIIRKPDAEEPAEDCPAADTSEDSMQ